MSVNSYLDVSTGHMRYQDSILSELFADADADADGKNGSFLPRFVKHVYGYVIFLSEGHHEEQIEALKQAGFSKMFLSVVKLAISKSCFLIIFDRDGYMFKELAFSNW